VLLAIEIRGGEPADSTANNDEVINRIARVHGIPLLAVAQFMRGLERTCVAAAQALPCRRIVICRQCIRIECALRQGFKGRDG
jgi:hypothetical protein